jgi:RNA recognition motif-containing protein
LPFSTQWQDLKDLLRPAGRILRADIALAPDGRSKGWGTAVFATPQEAQNAIDTFDGWEVDGRIIKVRWDKFQGTSSDSPQMVNAALSSPQMIHANLSPAQTPRPTEYMTVPTNPQQWQNQFLQPTLRPISLQPMTGPASPMAMGTTAHSQYGQAYPQFMAGPTSSTSPPQNIPSQYSSMLYNPQSGGWFQTNYTANMQPSMQPQVRLPVSSTEPFNVGISQQQPNTVAGSPQQRRSAENHDVYGFP